MAAATSASCTRFDEWAISPTLTVDYGARYAHYDYLQQRGLLSPRFGVAVEALPGNDRPRRRRAAHGCAGRRGIPDDQRARSVASARAHLRAARRAGGGSARRARARFFDIGLERQLGDAVVVGVSRFHQSVDDQLVTIFGLSMPGGPRSVGHYYVAGAGAVEADGWQVRLNTSPNARLQGSVQYSRTEAQWIGRSSQDLLRSAATATIRPDVEDIHDLTTSLTADIRETATRVFVICKVNNGFVESADSARHRR